MSNLFIIQIPTALIFFCAAIVIASIRSQGLRGIVLLLTPILALFQIYQLGLGEFYSTSLFQMNMELMRVDKLSRVFGVIFCIAAFLGNLYAWHVRDKVQQVATLLYTGSAIGAVFAGDFLSLFFYWEGTAIASVFLIWARCTQASFHTGMRYLIVQIGSGVVLLAGLALRYHETDSLEFGLLELSSLSSWLIFFAFGIKCAFPLLHNWLQDSYPAGTVTGTVILSSFTTKLAVYALARSFAGTEILIYVGAVMTVFPIFFAEIENDLRRVLAYSLNNQLGFMVVGIGVGTELALNGTASHAFAHILYKSLLFMSVGAVLFRTGTSKASELGGLYRTMPLTALFCLVGAASISAFPLFSGFVTKSLILDATASEHYPFIWCVLVFASAGVLSHSGIKVPYFTFFAHDSGLRPQEAPLNMLMAMSITAFLCIFLGVFPNNLYILLPYEVAYAPYTISHVLSQLQLLCFALLAFTFIMKIGLHPPEIRAINLDTDWIYRKFLPEKVSTFGTFAFKSIDSFYGAFTQHFIKLSVFLKSIFGPTAIFVRASQNNSLETILVWFGVIFLGALLILLF
ncbi:MAG: Na(+)/H(+) antiporter subunit D [Pseudomonadota bacterium]|nr:Na(+)/H(+) antiporter subunit D [Pseudomonadota bacterium]